MVSGVSVITLYGRVGSFSPEERARIVEKRIQALASDRFFSPETLAVSEGPTGFDISSDENILLTITEADAKGVGRSREEVARVTLRNVREAIKAERLSHTPKDLLTRSAYFGGACLLLILLLFAIVFSFRRLYKWLDGDFKKKIKPLRFGPLELMSSENVAKFSKGLLRIIRIITIVSVFYFYIPLALSFFPMTANLAPTLLSHLLTPIRALGHTIIEFIPDLISIFLIILVTNFILKFIRVFFIQIDKGTLQIKGFYPEWANPTYSLIRILVIALAFVAAFPYIPGSRSPAFQAVSVFLGVLFSLGSSSAVSNVVAGVVLTYMRPFKIGDRVKISDTMGDIIEKSLLITRIRTVKNVDITIPNSMVLASHIINYSSSSKDLGLILNTQVTIGYDASWSQVHELLVNAATKTEGILQSPKPFVLQISLNDFTITYELNAYTHESNKMATLYSRLHENIQNEFNVAGVEILSPNFVAYRDGSKPK